MSGLDYVLDRTFTNAARRETDYRYFTESERFAAWWGAGSHIDPVPGGAVHIRFPNAVVAGGEVLEIAPPERIVFTYGFESGRPMPLGASLLALARKCGFLTGERLELGGEVIDVGGIRRVGEDLVDHGQEVVKCPDRRQWGA
jgi:uncharacterized protein YndB with AHSA1/START domain